MPLNSLYAVWAIVFSVVLTGLHPTPQLVVGVLVSFGGALLVVSSAPVRRRARRERSDLPARRALTTVCARPPLRQGTFSLSITP